MVDQPRAATTYCPQGIQRKMAGTKVYPSRHTIEGYAFVALHLLDKTGPAGWLHKAWQQWGREEPNYLELLTQHSLALDYLLTPAAFPRTAAEPNWDKQFTLTTHWQKRGRRDPYALQIQLLEASNATRFPHPYLFYSI